MFITFRHFNKAYFSIQYIMALKIPRCIITVEQQLVLVVYTVLSNYSNLDSSRPSGRHHRGTGQAWQSSNLGPYPYSRVQISEPSPRAPTPAPIPT